MNLPVQRAQNIKQKVLEENRRVHARENRLYLSRHPEQTNFFQTGILSKTIEKLCSGLKGPNAQILDLGCGTGYLYRRFMARGYRVTGVDLSREMIQVLEKDIPEGAGSRLNLVVADVEEFLERDTGSYDAVVLSALLHHLYDYQSVLKQICGKLAPEGQILIFFEPLKQKIRSLMKNRAHRLLARLDESLYKLEMGFKGIPLFEEDYKLADYQRRFGGIPVMPVVDILRSQQMEILNVETYCARRYGLPAFLATRLLRTRNTFNLLAKKILF